MNKRRELPLVCVVAVAAVVLAAALSMTSTSGSTDADQPQQRNPFAVRQTHAAGYTGWDYVGGYWYYYENGQMVKNAWRMDSTDWAYLGSDGRAYQNTWAYLSDSSGTFWYYFGSAAHIVRNCWAPDSTSWGYLDGDGHAVTGWQYIDYYRYYFHPSSASMQTGWLSYGGAQYYLRPSYNTPAPGPNGAMLESGLWELDGVKCWFKADGRYDPGFNATDWGSTTTPARRMQIANNYTFYSRGSYHQNCLTFALDGGNYRLWPWEGAVSLNDAKTYLKECGYTIYSVSAPLSYPYIVAYQKNGNVTHFARVNETGCTYAKWGYCEIFRHSTYDPYTDHDYGSPAFCAK